jgi:hypothetical protein
MDKTTSLDQLKRIGGGGNTMGNDEPMPIPLNEDDSLPEEEMQNKETMNNIIHYFEDMQQQPPSHLQPISTVQKPPQIIYTESKPLKWKSIVRVVTVFLLFGLFLLPQIQHFLRLAFTKWYQVNGMWTYQGILVLSGILTLLYSGVEIVLHYV